MQWTPNDNFCRSPTHLIIIRRTILHIHTKLWHGIMKAMEDHWIDECDFNFTIIKSEIRISETIHYSRSGQHHEIEIDAEYQKNRENVLRILGQSNEHNTNLKTNPIRKQVLISHSGRNWLTRSRRQRQILRCQFRTKTVCSEHNFNNVRGWWRPKFVQIRSTRNKLDKYFYEPSNGITHLLKIQTKTNNTITISLNWSGDPTRQTRRRNRYVVLDEFQHTNFWDEQRSWPIKNDNIELWYFWETPIIYIKSGTNLDLNL